MQIYKNCFSCPLLFFFLLVDADSVCMHKMRVYAIRTPELLSKTSIREFYNVHSISKVIKILNVCWIITAFMHNHQKYMHANLIVLILSKPMCGQSRLVAQRDIKNSKPPYPPKILRLTG